MQRREGDDESRTLLWEGEEIMAHFRLLFLGHLGNESRSRKWTIGRGLGFWMGRWVEKTAAASWRSDGETGAFMSAVP